jgi:hypothetical protein
MSKLNQWLTLVANLSVVVGIVFLAVEMRQNTSAIQAQTRDSITEKQMDLYGWAATNRDLSNVVQIATTEGLGGLDAASANMFRNYVNGVFREWENSHYQYGLGLFSEGEFQGRVNRWRRGMSLSAFRDSWVNISEDFSPSFRAEIDRIVAEVEQAQ